MVRQVKAMRLCLVTADCRHLSVVELDRAALSSLQSSQRPVATLSCLELLVLKLAPACDHGVVASVKAAWAGVVSAKTWQ